MITKINFSVTKEPCKKKVISYLMEISFNWVKKQFFALLKFYFHNHQAHQGRLINKFQQHYLKCWRLPYKNVTKIWGQHWWRTWYFVEVVQWFQGCKIVFIVNLVTLAKIWEFNLTGKEGTRHGLEGAWLDHWACSNNWP